MDADKCGWQTESGTVNSPAFCNRSVEIGHSYCAEHERDAAELYPGKELPEPLTAVVFRVWLGDDGGDVIALFPYVQGSPGFCDSYQHIGQHGSADYIGLVGGGWGRGRRTRPAKPEEYAGLKRELESEPYKYRLKVVKRVNHDLHRKAVTAR